MVTDEFDEFLAPRLEIDVSNYEEDCGRACTPNGCCGHDTGIPERITVNGFPLILESFAHGDWPFLDQDGADQPQEIQRWKDLVTRLKNLCATHR